MALPESTLWAPYHTSKVFDVDALPELIHDATHWLRALKKRLQFNTIAVSGHSGLILGALVADRMKMPLLAVRKNDDRSCADGFRVNGTRLADCRYIVLDDLISSGSTLRRIVEEIDKTAQKELEDRYESTRYKYLDGIQGPLTEAQLQECEPMPVPKCVGVLLFNTDADRRSVREEFPHPLNHWMEKPREPLSVFHLSVLTKHGGLL